MKKEKRKSISKSPNFWGYKQFCKVILKYLDLSGEGDRAYLHSLFNKYEVAAQSLAYYKNSCSLPYIIFVTLTCTYFFTHLIFQTYLPQDCEFLVE